MNTCLQCKRIVWNGKHRDWAVNHDIVGNPKESVVIPRNGKVMMWVNDMPDRVQEGLLRVSVFVNVFASKYESDEVIAFVGDEVFTGALSELCERMRYDRMGVEEISHSTKIADDRPTLRGSLTLRKGDEQMAKTMWIDKIHSSIKIDNR